MRITLSAIMVISFVAGCDGKPLTGPDAQRAVAQVGARIDRLPAGILVIVDGKRLAADRTIRDIDAATIATIEVVKGGAARGRFGEDGAHGVIAITTKAAAAVTVESTPTGR